MTEKKKRGLLSWLGFGEEEQSLKTQNEANVEKPDRKAFYKVAFFVFLLVRRTSLRSTYF